MPTIATVLPDLGDLVSRYPAIGPTLASIAIFLNGCQYSSNRKHSAALGWWIWAELILLASFVALLVQGSWPSAALVAGAALAELSWIIRYQLRDSSDQ
jgi:hypothetical protein